MKYASSIRFGGQLVEAIACDYDDYKRMGLLCPECKDPVYLRKDSTRMSGDRSITIPACFCHFPTKDPELAKVCEKRVAGYTQEDIDRARAIARNQRLKLLQRWFWEVFEKEYVESQKYVEYIDEAARQSAPTAEQIINFVASEMYAFDARPLELSVSCVLDMMQKNRNEVNENLSLLASEFAPYLQGEKEPKNDETGLMRRRLNLLSKVDLMLHKQIVFEVLEFLTAKRQRAILKRFVAVQMYSIIGLLDEKGINKEYKWNQIMDVPEIREFITCKSWHYTIIFLWGIPWSDVFESLSKDTRPIKPGAHAV